MAKILVVDDDKDILNYFTVMLAADGHEAHGENCAVKGLGWLTQQHPDLVVTDIFMPDMDGFEFIRKIRETESQAKILAMSAGARGFSQQQTLAAAKDFGADGILEKPFERDKILSFVERLLAS